MSLIWLWLCYFLASQELSPTTDTNLIKSLMNFIDCQMDEFHDEAKISQMDERQIVSWLEVGASGDVTCSIQAPESGNIWNLLP